MKAIILCAGIGSRIRPLTNNTHKSLLKIGDRTILEMAITNLLNLGITDVAIITGYKEEQIKSFMQQTFPKLTVTYIRNDKYLDTNTGYSLLLAKDFVKGDAFVKFDGDVVFEEEILRRLIENNYPSSLSIDRNIHLAAEEVKAAIDNNNKVIKVGKKIPLHEAKGESIGIEKINSDAGEILFDELEKLMQNPENLQRYYDDSYTTLNEKGIPLYAVDITGLKWVEIDTHEDYALAQEIFHK